MARERVRETGLLRFELRPFAESRAAFFRVSADTVPLRGGGNFTPARRAFESPIAMACLVERAPCSPARISSISSRTNSPAWVLGDFPSRRSLAARLRVDFLGMQGF